MGLPPQDDDAASTRQSYPTIRLEKSWPLSKYCFQSLACHHRFSSGAEVPPKRIAQSYAIKEVREALLRCYCIRMDTPIDGRGLVPKMRCLAALYTYRPFGSKAPECLVPAQHSLLLQAQAWRICITTKVQRRSRPQSKTRGHRGNQCSVNDALVVQECSHT